LRILLPLATLISLAGCADVLLLHPPKHADPPHGAQQRAIPFRDGILQIWTQRSSPQSADPPAAYVLEFIGNASRAEYHVTGTAYRWRSLNAEVWSVNYPGYGQSTGPPSIRSIAPSALAAYDALTTVADGKPIFITGRSLGTTAALHVAAHRPIAGLVLHSPTPLRQVILGFGWWNLWLLAAPVALQVPAELDSLANAAHSRGPAIFILTERDELVSPASQQRVIAACAGPKRIINLPRAGHNDSATPDEEQSIEAAIAWLKTQPRRGAGP
jgi:pimeloyl-ACP methyl ester carboxylesterase